MDARAISMLSLLSLLGGCDPSVEMRGSVHRPDAAPVAGATVRTVCSPQGSDYGEMTATTKADGTFSASGLGSLDDACRLEVLVTDEPVRKFPPLDYCTDEQGDSCLSLDARLTIPYP